MNATPVFPARLAGILLRPLPRRVIEPVLAQALALIERKHPELFSRLGNIAPTRILIEATDLPHAFLFILGEGAPQLFLAGPEEEHQAKIKGSLSALIELLEGRTDGDALFFSRALTITGDTEAIVALRNSVDGAEISLFQDIISLFGPLARPAEKAALAIDGLLANFMEDMKAFHKGFHGGKDLEAENAAIKEQLAQLQARVNKLEARKAR